MKERGRSSCWFELFCRCPAPAAGVKVAAVDVDRLGVVVFASFRVMPEGQGGLTKIVKAVRRRTQQVTDVPRQPDLRSHAELRMFSLGFTRTERDAALSRHGRRPAPPARSSDQDPARGRGAADGRRPGG